MTDEQKAELEVIRYEVGYRREKQWKIFSWSATLLVAAIAGVITLVGDDKFKFPLWPRRAEMAAALIVITAYAYRWIHEHIAFETRARAALFGFLKNTTLSEEMIQNRRPVRFRIRGHTDIVEHCRSGHCAVCVVKP